MRNLIGLSIAFFALQGCGSDSTSVDMTTGPDMAAAGDMSVPPVNTGTLILPASQYVATTADDQAIAFTGLIGGISAVSLSGGTPTVVDASSASVAVSGKVVFSWSSVTSVATVGNLTLWASGKTPRMASMKSFSGVGAATTDGTYIAYADNAVQGGATDIVVGKFDGTGSVTTVVTGADTANTECPIIIAHSGTGFFIEYCTGSAAMDMGTTVAHLVYVDPAAATPMAVSLSTDAANFGIDKAGDKAWYLDSTKKLFYTAVPPAGAATQVDTDVSTAYMNQDGSALVWSTSGGALKRAATSAVGTATTLTATGSKLLRAVSADETQGFITDVDPNKDNSQSNLAYTSLVTAGTPTKLVTDSSGVLYGPAFTPDSKIALWYDKNATSVATLHQTTLSSGMSAKIADTVWNHETVTNTKILYMDNYKAGVPATATGKADLSAYDLATGTVKVIVNAAQARNSIDLSQDKSKVIYDYQNKAMKSMSGVYVAPAQ